ncbi:MAG: hypothetical protein F4X52_11645 [Acidimicrobiaceae bacterium]|nr:hypothetical protein [Acidimicrobiaceae bacterium]
MPASPAASVAGFGDIAQDMYFTEPVQWLVDNNIVTDTTAPCFSPYAPATRGETALYMWRMEGTPEAPMHPFSDVTDDEHQTAVSWMYANGITTGTSPSTFGPDQQLTRAQLAALLHRLAGEPSASDHPFADVVAGWQQQPVAWMVANKITIGTRPTTFAPDEPVTRGQLATFLYRYSGSPDVTVDPRSPPCDGFSDLDSGGQHSCAVRTNATIACWGNNQQSQADPPDGYFKVIGTGWSHTCGIRTDNTIACWGTNWTGPNDPPSGEFKAISAGRSHTCGIRTDNTITCWGHNEHRQADAPAGQFTAISAGGSHTCALRTDNTITCWGHNGYRQANAPAGQFSAISASSHHSCAIGTDKAVTCWGDNLNDRADAPNGRFSAISTARYHSCGLRTDNTITCWGDNLNDRADAPHGQFIALSTSTDHSCGLHVDSTITCWGRPVIPTPQGVQLFVAPGQPHPEACRPSANSEQLTAGFPLPARALPSVGTVRVAVLFVDFPNAMATHPTQLEAHMGLPYIEDYLEASNYDKVDIEFMPLHQWLRAGNNFEEYLVPTAIGGTAIGRRIIAEAARLADLNVDFTDHDAIMVVLPSSRFGDGIARGVAHTNEGTVHSTARINSNPLDQQRAPHRWGLIGAHELAHNFGLLDMYPYEQHLHTPPQTADGGALTRTRVQVGLMGLQVHYPGGLTDWDADEMLAWSRWQLQWLDPSQVHCVTEAESTIALGAVGDPGDNFAMAAIPLSETEVIVIESRRQVGYDASEALSGRTGLGTEGVLVYTVDTSVGTGHLPVKVATDTGDGFIDHNPILRNGQSVTTNGYTITVQSTTETTHTVSITRTAGD